MTGERGDPTPPGGGLALAALCVYVLILGLGILAEAFEIDAILALPIY